MPKFDSEKTHSELIEENAELRRNNALLREYYMKLNDIVDRFDREVQDLYASLGSR